jgi:hypothetical protein
MRGCLKPIRVLFCPIMFLVSLVTAIGYAQMYTLYYTLSTTFQYRQFRRVGLAYLGTAADILVSLIVGGLLGAMVVGRKARKVDWRHETRLFPMTFFWPLIDIGRIAHTWGAEKHKHWIWPMVETEVLSWCHEYYGKSSIPLLIFIC